MKKYDSDGNAYQSPGLSGGASAFQAGFNMVGNKPKTPKPKKMKSAGGAGKSANNQGQGLMQPTATFQSLMPGLTPVVGSKKHGGRIRKTGLYLMHRGENVIPAKSRRKSVGYKKSIVKA